MSAIDDLRTTIARLRAPGGCPWDIEQTHQSLARCLVDETSELLEAIDDNDLPHMREELGDVLIQVLFHAQIASENGAFDFDDVAREVNEKLIRRHPHVFGGNPAGVRDTAGVLSQWEQIKRAEKTAAGAAPERPPLFKKLPPRLPALLFAEAVWNQFRKNKLPSVKGADAKHIANVAADLDEAEIGEMLFTLAAAARERGVDPESALRRHAQRVVDEAVKAAEGN
ncbi:MAG: MazG family protein [Opitutaceae bacterium]|jgi:XTP/dITP diphosphohydrolase/tetrapyrrole methylase family protein/MazG family protein|nr:MazG family protein [Opitutaceae bacterium]